MNHELAGDAVVPRAQRDAARGDDVRLEHVLLSPARRGERPRRAADTNAERRREHEVDPAQTVTDRREELDRRTRRPNGYRARHHELGPGREPQLPARADRSRAVWERIWLTGDVGNSDDPRSVDCRDTGRESRAERGKLDVRRRWHSKREAIHAADVVERHLRGARGERRDDERRRRGEAERQDRQPKREHHSGQTSPAPRRLASASLSRLPGTPCPIRRFERCRPFSFKARRSSSVRFHSRACSDVVKRGGNSRARG